MIKRHSAGKRKETSMVSTSTKMLIKDPRVVNEINKHLWIESEKAGRDIGFDQAAEDWVERFSGEWMKYNMPASGKTKMTRRKARQTKLQ